MPKDKEPKNIEEQEVIVLRGTETDRGAVKLRVVRWIVDGKDTGPQLEKRSYFKTKDGGLKMSKAKGFNKSDVEFLFSNKDEIMACFQ
jgi:hypothetical protein